MQLFFLLYLCSKILAVDVSVKTFKIISTLEALSFLILLGIAMPLKYIWEMPQMVQIVGMAHGVLFLLYIAGAVYMSQKLHWNWKTLAIVVLCSVVPFGPFYVERKYL
jgi:integral membrane protein